MSYLPTQSFQIGAFASGTTGIGLSNIPIPPTESVISYAELAGADLNGDPYMSGYVEIEWRFDAMEQTDFQTLYAYWLPTLNVPVYIRTRDEGSTGGYVRYCVYKCRMRQPTARMGYAIRTDVVFRFTNCEKVATVNCVSVDIGRG